MERVTFEMYGEQVWYEKPTERPERIIGGNVAPDFVDLSYMVTVVYDRENPIKSFHCAGSAITSNVILSAAHCFKLDYGVENMWVRVGESDLNSADATYLRVMKVIVPPYSGNDDDIALVYVNYYGLRSLPLIKETDTVFRDNIFLYGYGDTDYETKGSQISAVPKYIDLYEQPPEVCDPHAGLGQTCLTDQAENVNNVYYGDSGGPGIQLVRDSTGSIFWALRGTIAETDPERAPDYTIITDLKISENRNFVDTCIANAEQEPELCEIRYARKLPPNTLIPTPVSDSAPNSDLHTVTDKADVVPLQERIYSQEEVVAMGLLFLALMGHQVYKHYIKK